MANPLPLPRRPLCDTGVIMRALGERPDDPRSPDCVWFFNAMVLEKREILIAAPSISEILRGNPASPVPRVAGILAVGFDAIAAEWLGKQIPQYVIVAEATAAGVPGSYIKYDAMIVACAVRHNADCYVSIDERSDALVRRAGLVPHRPHEFKPPDSRQPDLFRR